MANEILGSSVVLEISTNLTTPAWKRLMCRKNLEADLSADVKEHVASCGVLQVPGLVKGTITGSGIADSNPSGTEVTEADLRAIVVNRTKVLARYTDNPTTPASAEVHVQGEGYFTRLRISAPVDDVVEYDFDFNISGTPVIVGS